MSRPTTARDYAFAVSRFRGSRSRAGPDPVARGEFRRRFRLAALRAAHLMDTHSTPTTSQRRRILSSGGAPVAREPPPSRVFVFAPSSTRQSIGCSLQRRRRQDPPAHGKVNSRCRRYARVAAPAPHSQLATN